MRRMGNDRTVTDARQNSKVEWWIVEIWHTEWYVCMFRWYESLLIRTMPRCIALFTRGNSSGEVDEEQKSENTAQEWLTVFKYLETSTSDITGVPLSFLIQPRKTSQYEVRLHLTLIAMLPFKCLHVFAYYFYSTVFPNDSPDRYFSKIISLLSRFSIALIFRLCRESEFFSATINFSYNDCLGHNYLFRYP